MAERLRALRDDAQASLQGVQPRSFLDPWPPIIADDQGYISAIGHALAKLRQSARQARENAIAFRDDTTAGLFGNLASAIDAQIWFLRSPNGRRRIPSAANHNCSDDRTEQSADTGSDGQRQGTPKCHPDRGAENVRTACSCSDRSEKREEYQGRS